MSVFHVGDVWEPEGTITPKGSTTPVKPGSITITFVAPSGKTHPSEATTELSTGVYTGKIKLTEPGFWGVNFDTTEPYEASAPSQIVVHPKYGER